MGKTALLTAAVFVGAALGIADMASAMETNSPAMPQEPTTQPANPSGHKAHAKKPKPKKRNEV